MEYSQRLFKTSESVVLDPGQGLGVTHTPEPIFQSLYSRAYIQGPYPRLLTVARGPIAPGIPSSTSLLAILPCLFDAR